MVGKEVLCTEAVCSFLVSSPTETADAGFMFEDLLVHGLDLLHKIVVVGGDVAHDPDEVSHISIVDEGGDVVRGEWGWGLRRSRVTFRFNVFIFRPSLGIVSSSSRGVSGDRTGRNARKCRTTKGRKGLGDGGYTSWSWDVSVRI